MTHYYIELFVWLLFAYLVGCVIGALARKVMARAPQAEAPIADLQPATVMAAASQQVDEAPSSEAEPLPGRAPLAPRWTPAKEQSEPETEALADEDQHASAVLAAAAPIRARMPVGISAPRSGGPDELQRISGVGPKNEQILHSLGFYHFDQISQWTDEQVEWVDGYLRFNGRIRRENWVEQCRLLAAGDEEEFARLYGTGGMADEAGLTHSGEKTRR